MKVEKINSCLSLSADIGVVIGLILVVYQINREVLCRLLSGCTTCYCSVFVYMKIVGNLSPSLQTRPKAHDQFITLTTLCREAIHVLRVVCN